MEAMGSSTEPSLFVSGAVPSQHAPVADLTIDLTSPGLGYDKLGERIWLQARDEERARQGAAFDLKAFHREALDLGNLGLDPMREALALID